MPRPPPSCTGAPPPREDRGPTAEPAPAHPASGASISIRGAREHNLRAVDVDLPRNRLVVFTGVSGSGKSSLAFDTLYAEGQRRYVESLSAYARQFMGQMDKPRYDTIRGLTPTIAVSQGAATRNPRSTVGTLTEVLDHLRLLYARVGIQHCHRCQRPLDRHSAPEIVSRIQALPAGTRFLLLAPVVRDTDTPLRDVLAEIRRAGFTRVQVGGEVHRLDTVDAEALGALPAGAAETGPSLELVVDRLKVREGMAERLTDSVETALEAGEGVVICQEVPRRDAGPGARHVFTEQLACLPCGTRYPKPSPASFSFNSPRGMCPDCNGLGRRNEMDPDRVVPDPTLTLHEGAIHPWRKVIARRDSWNHRILEELGRVHDFDLDTPWQDLSPLVRERILHGDPDREFEVDWEGRRGEGRFRMTWEGVIPGLMRRMKETRSSRMRKLYLSYMSQLRCTRCGGERIRPEVAAVRVGGLRLPELAGETIRDLRRRLRALELDGNRATIAAELLREIDERLRFLEDVGLAYLELSRPASTLSGGESQRIRLASQLGGELTGVTYVLDEPSIGLHARDNRRLVETLRRLRDLGNTVVVVEHDRDTIESADHVVDFGPGAGKRGGEVVFAGTPVALADHPSSVTGRYLSGRERIPVPAQRRRPPGPRLVVRGPRHHNLQGMDVEIPLGLLVAVTGVSGAGKSTLVQEILAPAIRNARHGAARPVGRHDGIDGMEHVRRIVEIDQAPIGRTPRSNPATYTGLLEPIRRVFAATPEARMRGYAPGRFGFNTRGGRCEACKGQGFERIEMQFLPDVYVPCEVCQGKRFNEATLQVRYRDRNIADVLALPVEEALDLFENHRTIRRILATLRDVGLGYLELGQPSNTLSGGEAQRIKLARELARPRKDDTLYVLDEPTTGLHFADMARLIEVLQRLVDGGDTVVVVEHDLEVVKCADHVVDLGPEGGDEGGRVVARGTPEEIARARHSHTGRLLGPLLTAGEGGPPPA